MKKFFYVVILVFVVSGLYFLINNELKIHKFDFKAKSLSGEVNMKSFDGKYKIVFFGYMFCPDICPTTLNLVANALNELQAQDTQILFVTLDLQRDEIAQCDEYVKYFYSNSTCIKFDKRNDLDKMVKNYDAKYKIIDQNDSNMSYSIAHSSFIYLFDKKGRFVKDVSNLTYSNVKAQIQNLIKNH